MFNVTFKQGDENVVIIRKCATIEEGVAFALDLHRTSNKRHEIAVCHINELDPVLTLYGSENEN